MTLFRENEMMPGGATSAVKAVRKKDDQVTIVEVSPRDGLPEVCDGLSTDDKIKYINKLSETGLKKIECASFSHPRLLPEGYHVEKLIFGIVKKPDVPTEDLVHLFEEMGIKMGIDLESLLDCVRLAEKMAGSALPGHLLRAGHASQISKIPQYLIRE